MCSLTKYCLVDFWGAQRYFFMADWFQALKKLTILYQQIVYMYIIIISIVYHHNINNATTFISEHFLVGIQYLEIKMI